MVVVGIFLFFGRVLVNSLFSIVVIFLYIRFKVNVLIYLEFISCVFGVEWMGLNGRICDFYGMVV